MDWFEWQDVAAQAWDFHDIDSIATPLYVAASQKLDELEGKFQQEAIARRGEAKTDDEYHMACEDEEWEARLHLRKKQALGALALHLLQLSLRQRLDRAKGYFDATHPHGRGYKAKKGRLNQLKAEYKDRFKVNFNDSPVPYSRIEELVLARNAGIHADSPGTFHNYLNKIPSPRFVNDDGEFSVDGANYQCAVRDVKDFTKWVISELRKLRV